MTIKIKHRDGFPFCNGEMIVSATKDIHFSTGKPVYVFTDTDRLGRYIRYTIECTECIEVSDE